MTLNGAHERTFDLKLISRLIISHHFRFPPQNRLLPRERNPDAHLSDVTGDGTEQRELEVHLRIIGQL